MKTQAASAAIGLVATGLLMAAPAQAAAPPQNHETFSGVDEPFTECGGAYDGLSTWSNTLTILDSNPSLDGQFFRFTNQYQFTDTLTNVDTGDHVTISGRGIYKELQPRSQGGGIFTYITHDAGLFTIRDSSGDVLIREAGVITFSYEFDTRGDSTPGGDTLTEQFLGTSGPHATWDPAFDFCSLLDGATG